MEVLQIRYTFSILHDVLDVVLFRHPCSSVEDSARVFVWRKRQRLMKVGHNNSHRYFLLLVGGVFGLHWWYLGDSRKFQLYLRTLGLCFLGVLLDVWELPWIVAEVNSNIVSENGK